MSLLFVSSLTGRRQGEKDNEKKFIEPVGSLYSLDLKEYLMGMFSHVFLFVFPTRLGNSVSQHILLIFIFQARFSNYISQYIRDVSSSIELHAISQLSQVQIMQLSLEFC